MSKILVAEGFGNLTDGTHVVASDREILGEQWPSVVSNYVITDIADGRKWISPVAFAGEITLSSWAWSGETEIYFACRVYRPDTTTPVLCNFFDGVSHLGALIVNPSGNLVYSKFGVPNATNGIVATSSAAIPLDTPTHIEARIIFNNSTGSVKIWINGVLDSDTTGIDTIYAGTSCNKVRILNALSPHADWKLTDFIVHNDSDHLGDIGVYYFPADGDGADTDFTPSAGSDHYAMLDEIGPDEDTTYNESDGTAGHRDTLDTDDPTGLTIVSVAPLVRARKTGASAATLLVGAVHSASETQSSAKALSTDYLTLLEFIDDVPGGSGWTLTQVQDALVSYEVGA